MVAGGVGDVVEVAEEPSLTNTRRATSRSWLTTSPLMIGPTVRARSRSAVPPRRETVEAASGYPMAVFMRNRSSWASGRR